MAILNPKYHAGGLVDALGIAVVKQVEERFLAGVIGNGTLMSGAIKLVVGGVVQPRGRYGNIVGSAFVIDGVEDIVVSLLGGKSQQSASGGNSAVW